MAAGARHPAEKGVRAMIDAIERVRAYNTMRAINAAHNHDAPWACLTVFPNGHFWGLTEPGLIVVSPGGWHGPYESEDAAALALSEEIDRRAEQ